MDIDQFTYIIGEIVMYSQLIEHDVKLIYSYIREGNINENYLTIMDCTLGQAINNLEQLDNLDDKPYISKDDYVFLKKMKNKRNYWCHKCFADFVYIAEKNLCSKVYNEICKKLNNECHEFKIVHNNLERIRIEICKIND